MKHPAPEFLEARIAPATLVNPTTVTFTDVDGDDVTVKITKGTFDPAFTEFLFDEVTPGFFQLQWLDLRASEFAGTNVTITAKRNAAVGGDGLVNVGFIVASDGITLRNDLGAVTVDGDLGGLRSGDADPSTPALKSLKALSLGSFGAATQGLSSNSDITTFGSIGKVTVAGDVRTGFQVTGSDGNADIGSFTIGGSLIGGSTFQSGTLEVLGSIGPVKIAGSLIGGTGNLSGGISANGDIASVTIGGSLIGGSAPQSGEIEAGGKLGPVKIGRDLLGGSAANAGRIRATGAIASLTIGGSVFGGSLNVVDAQIFSGDALGMVKIGGLVRAGTGSNGGSIVADSLAGVKIGGALIGGTGSNTASIRAVEGSAGAIVIGGIFEPGPAVGSGVISADTTIKSVTVGGTWRRFAGGDSEISAGSIGSVRIGGDLHSAGGLPAIMASFGGSVGSVTVGGDIIGGSGAGVLIGGGVTLKSLTVKGSIIGTEAFPVLIQAQDAINKIAIGGRSEFAILQAFGPDGVIGSVTVKGDFVASRIAAGTGSGADNIAGTLDDSLLGGGNAARLSTIARVTIKGQAYGTVGGTDSFGIIGEKVGKVSVAGTAIPLPPSVGDVFVGFTADLFIRDLQIT